MDTVLLATDGSEYGQAATAAAVRQAAEQEATLHAICVVDTRRVEEPALGSAALSTVYAEDNAQECVSGVVERASEVGVPVESVIRRGVPHEVILDYAAAIDADVIVLGAHGDHDTHFSGVGQKVRDHSDRDVAIVTA